MTTIERPNKNALNEALDVYRDTMRAFIIRYLERQFGDRIKDRIGDAVGDEFFERLSKNGRSIEGTIDIKDFRKLIDRYWKITFAPALNGDKDKLGSLLESIVDARNEAAHPDTRDMKPKYVERRTAYIAEILGQINESEAVRAVVGIRGRLFAHSHGIGRVAEERREYEVTQPSRRFRPSTILDEYTGFDIVHLMEALSQNRPIFHSEEDFAHSIRSLIQETIPGDQVQLMHQLPHEDRSMYLDVWLPADGIAIQLRHATQKLELDWDDVSFELKAHGAQDLTRYDLLRDIQRLEHALARSDMCKTGLAILLTNDPLYWKSPHRAGTIDAAFRIHEGRELTGELAWAAHAGAGTTRGRETPIRLEGSYTMHWQDYSNFAGEKYGEFRYLAVAIQ